MRSRFLTFVSVAGVLVTGLLGCSDSDPVSTPLPDAAALYRVTFTSTWSPSTHPTDFPESAHFSPLVGATHCDCGGFWATGDLATPGIKSMAEQGATSTLRAEIEDAIDSAEAEFVILGNGLGTSPASTSLSFPATLMHPRVTLVSMVAPSPDWFVGVSGLPLLDAGGRWIDSLTVELYPYDAGTDSGTSYASPNATTDPPVGIALISEGPLWVNNSLPPAGTFTFVRQ